MRRLSLGMLVLCLAAMAFAVTKKRTPQRVRTPLRITAAQRAAARDEIARRLRAADLRIENAEALAPFDEALRAEGGPVHILQFGDSHTASDDWVNSMRLLLQTKYGDGGPGFVQAGRPYKGYRRFDAHGQNSPGWRTEGTLALGGDANQGLSGVSISTEAAGQTVSLSAAGELLSLFYLRQPGGGALELTADGQPLSTFTTEGETGAGIAEYTLPPGPHELLLRTLDRAPVRLYGWALDNKQGLTFETLGINGAQASLLLGWSEAVWSAGVAARQPALVILAYGTNEANSHRWTPEQYRADLIAVLERVRRVAPQAAILMIGPPDCGKAQPLLHLTDVIRAQRDLAREQNVAFWDWRRQMGGAGAIRLWVTAGYAQADHIHMTGEGYRMVGEMIVTSLLEKRQDEQARENH
ncbi:MAG: GDSL-type esterase/lipase family protein [Acidobacteriota bacterium]